MIDLFGIQNSAFGLRRADHFDIRNSTFGLRPVLANSPFNDSDWFRKGRSQAGRFADLVALVRFALAQQPVLAPFADSVSERFNEWLMDKAKAGTVFTAEQLAWLNLMRDQIATSLSIEAEDLDLSPFNQRGGLGKAHQLFGEQLPKLLDELNATLAA
ncbi:MAG TPA: type I restriction-modification enzyme R subunit C-terminal domain-containing protein [Chthoniobacterales bacterium]|jgi:type I restriction enzyme R subunit